tara:strand:+ start:1028 stop:1408 length:381 start_codon:yes stop_codon:yes gene_type:complete
MKVNNIKVQEVMEIKVEQWEHTEMLDKNHGKMNSNSNHQGNRKFNRGKSFHLQGNKKFNRGKSFHHQDNRKFNRDNIFHHQDSKKLNRDRSTLHQDSSNQEIKEKKVSNQIMLSNKELNSDIKLKK